MGAVFCLLSAVGFGAMAVFGKLAFDEGVPLDALLLVRFGLAGAVLAAVALARGSFRGLRRRKGLTALAMGAVGYAAQAGLYFAALTRIDAALVALLLYVYPVLVMVAAVALGRDRLSVRRVAALLVALAGIALVLLGAGRARFDALGVLLALGAAVVYTGYILVGDRITGDVPPLALAALVCGGATGTFLAGSAVRGTPDWGFAPAGWLWLAAVALVSTVAAVLLFFAGLALVGPSTAALLSILEPVVTVVGAALVFGEALTAVQWAGAAAVLAAVGVVQWPGGEAARARDGLADPLPA